MTIEFFKKPLYGILSKLVPRDSNEKIKLKLIFRNFSWLFFDRVFRLGLGVVVTIWIARYLGPSGFGLLNYAIAFVALLGTLSNLGLDQIAIRTIVLEPVKKDEIIGTSFFLRIAGSILLIILSIILAAIMQPGDSLAQLLIIIIAFGTAFLSFDVIDYWFQATLRSKFTVIAKNSAFLLVSLLRIYFILEGFSVIAFAWAILLENVLGGMLLVIVYNYNKEKIFIWRFNHSHAVELLKNSWPLILSGIAVMIYMRIAQVMLKELVNDSAVGVYSAAARVAELWYFIPVAIVNSVFPVIVETKKTDEGLYYRRLSRLYSILTWASILISLAVTFTADYIILFLYGSEYEGAAAILSLSIWAGIFVFQGVARGIWLITENLQKYSYYYTVGACIVSIILNFLLIPVLGGIGAAISSIISYFAQVIVIPLFIKETRLSSIQLLKAFIWR